MITNILSILEKETKGNCYSSYRYCTDDELKVPTLNYDESVKFTIHPDRYGETDASLKQTKDLTYLAKQLEKSEPLFKFFLDGSRRTYKVGDIEINGRIFPIISGQVGVATCERRLDGTFRNLENDKNLIIVIPREANPEQSHPELFLNILRDKINSLPTVKKIGIQFSKVLTYSSKLVEDSKEPSNHYEMLGIAAIQDEMIDSEKRIVASLTTKNTLNEDNYLIKDGSLQYKPMKTGEFKELAKIKNNYRWVIGLSKRFNPEFSKDRGGKSNAASLAKLPLFHRTPAYKFQHDHDKWGYLGDFKYSVWYIRIRDTKYSDNLFAGIVKVEKILITEDENNNGLDSGLVDYISANVINERNPVCYGKDSRWANHIYPIFVTEQYLKNSYLSDIHYLNIF